MTQLQPYEDPYTIKKVARTLLSPIEVLAATRVPEGISTVVFQIDTPSAQYYLRIMHEQNLSFDSEVEAHEHLHNLGLHVPEVVAFEHQHESLQRSVMLTKAIPGRPIGYTDQPQSIREILLKTGRELAVINQLQIEGFGYINSVLKGHSLTAQYTSPTHWLNEDFREPLEALSASGLFTPPEVDKIFGVLDATKGRYELKPSFLAHGDFDVTHIYYDESGYTGIIDFGDIRGAPKIYDLGHFSIENGHLLQYLLEGYVEVLPLDDEAQYDILLTSILIAARRIGRRIRGRGLYAPDLSHVKRAIKSI